MSADRCSGPRAPVSNLAAAVTGTGCHDLSVFSLLCLLPTGTVSPHPYLGLRPEAPQLRTNAGPHRPLKARADSGPLVAAQSPELVLCLM